QMEMADGQKWNLQILTPALQVLRSGLRVLAPGHCRVTQGHRNALKNPGRLAKWAGGLSLGLLVFLSVLPPIAAFLAPIGYLLFLTIPLLIFALVEMKNRNQNRDWSLKDAARTATDLLRILPIMDSEYHTFRYAEPDRLMHKFLQTQRMLTRGRGAMAAAAILILYLAIRMPDSAIASLPPIMLIALAVLWLSVEGSARDKGLVAQLAQHRLVIKDRKLYLQVKGEERECRLRR